MSRRGSKTVDKVYLNHPFCQDELRNRDARSTTLPRLPAKLNHGNAGPRGHRTALMTQVPFDFFNSNTVLSCRGLG